jgi:hypothetical protein
MNEFMRTTQAKSHEKGPDLVESPYEWCLRYCMVQAARWVDDNKQEGLIAYTLDQGDRNRHRAQNGFDAAKANPEVGDHSDLGP